MLLRPRPPAAMASHGRWVGVWCVVHRGGDQTLTLAVCVRCGRMKHGAFTPCPKCSFDPADAADKAKAVMLTDHYFSKDQLEGIGRRIQSGLPVSFNQAQVDEIA